MNRMVEISIRELKEEDIDYCVDMTITSFPWTAFGLTKESAEKFFYDRLHKNLVFVAENNGEVLGFIAIKRNILFANYIRRIVVRKDKRSKGIGTSMLRFIEDITLNERLPNVFLITTIKNRKAVKFYKKNGYQIIGKIPNFIRKDLHEHILWKTFGPVNDFDVYD
jgi:ribosomal protein S18 acetylase RimI-like enzyme